jgi:hypothetical protein
MAINYPTSLDSLTNPVPGDDQDSPLHTDQHADANDAIEALEAKVGINSSAVATSLDYLVTNASSSNPGHKHTLAAGATDVTASAAELNKLDGVTASTAELNQVDGITVVSTDGAQTLTNKVLSTGVELDANADPNITYYGLARQAIINGNFDVWQRGTSIALTTADGYTADRWYVQTATAGTDKTVSRQDGTGVNGSYYCARVAMVQDVDELLTFSQALESQDSIKFRGQKVTLSFYARGGAEFVADNATLVSKIVTGKGTDQKVLAFTTSADAVSQNNTLTTSWVKFTCTTTAAIASDITQIGISFAFTHAGSGVTTNYFEITQVQLCAGDVALPFQPKSFEEELRACERYFEISGGTSNLAMAINARGCTSTTNAEVVYFFRTRKRATPAVTFSGAASVFAIDTPNTQVACSALSAAPNRIGDQAVGIEATTSGLTAGDPAMLRPIASGYMLISAEL